MTYESVEQSVERGVEVGRQAGVGPGGDDAGRPYGRKPAEALVSLERGYGRVAPAFGNENEGFELSGDGREIARRSEAPGQLRVEVEPYAHPAAPLAHHGQADVEQFAALDVGHQAYDGVFVEMAGRLLHGGHWSSCERARMACSVNIFELSSRRVRNSV